MKRILIIGLDGASPRLVQRWADELPHLQRLKERGAFGTLQSVVPPRSVPAWYCFATGVNPAKLGVFGFSQRRPGTYDYTFANFTYCQAHPFWHWLAQEQIEAGIIHLPGTFPPRPLRGFMVSGWPAPLNRGNLGYTQPAELSREIDERLGQPFEFVSPISIEHDNDAELLAERLRILKLHGDVAVDMLQRNPWQVAVTVLAPLDRASHQFWRHMDSGHPHHDPALVSRFGEALKEVYKASDKQLGRLLGLADEGDWVFVISDHGFGPIHRTFYLNEWLLRHGYLVLKDRSAEVSLRTRLLGRSTAPLFRLNQASPLFRRLSEPLKKRALSNFLRNQYVRAKEEGVVRLNHLPVDWSRTRAYAPDESSLYLNLQGRDPQGVVPRGAEAERLLDELEAALSKLQDPESGEPLAPVLYRKEEIYHGPFLDQAPELTVSLDHAATTVMAELDNGKLFDRHPKWSGNHTREGLFLATGPGIPAGARYDASLLDIAPTVLHLLRVAVPESMDGRALTDLFADNAGLAEIRYQDDQALKEDGTAFTEEEMQQVEQQLRDLGYLS